MLFREAFQRAGSPRKATSSLTRLQGPACALALYPAPVLVLVLVLTQGCALTPAEVDQAATTIPPRRAQPSISAVNRAEALYSQEQFELARESFHQLTEQYPGNAFFWFRLGNCEAQLAQYPQALQAFQQAIALDPTDGRFSYNLAFVYGALARDSFAKAQAQLPATSALVREASQNRRLIEAAVGPASSTRPAP